MIKQRDNILAKDLTNNTIPYIELSGNVNDYIANYDGITAYYKGLRFCIYVNVNYTGKTYININNLGKKVIKDSYGNDLSKDFLRKDMLYHIGYNGINFILLGKGGGGNAQPVDVLSGKTFTNDDGLQKGSMKNNGIQTFTPGIKGDNNLKSNNIANGVSIFGITGTINFDSFLFKYPVYELPLYKVNPFRLPERLNRNVTHGYDYDKTKDYYLGPHKIIVKFINVEYVDKLHYNREVRNFRGDITTDVEIIFPKNVLFIYRPNAYQASHSSSSASTSIYGYDNAFYFPKIKYSLIFPNDEHSYQTFDSTYGSMINSYPKFTTYVSENSTSFIENTYHFKIKLHRIYTDGWEGESLIRTNFYVVFNESVENTYE